MAQIDWRIRRLGQGVFTILAVLTLSFVMIRMMPGNPMGAMVENLRAQGINPVRARELVRIRLATDPTKPIVPAYFEYMVNFFQGELGYSTFYQMPVSQKLAEVMPWTLFVLSWGVFISFFTGMAVGALMAYWEGSKLDVGFTTFAILMGSIPFYVLAILMLIFTSYRWGWFPTGGKVRAGVDPGMNWPFIASMVRHATLPIMSYLVASGIASLGMRGNSIRVLGEDYLRVARLRGLSDVTISSQYVARNAVLPLYTTLLISIGEMFGGSVVLEQVFQYRGLGFTFYQALNQRDYALMMGGFALITIVTVFALLLADLTYGYIDPRARGGKDEAY
jgi:peptide/nickel transport system permease protein